MRHALKSLGVVFIVGSAVTLAAAYVLYRDGHPFLAFDVLLVSPFPCPGPVPC